MKAARKAFEKWSALPGSERAKYLFRIARIIQERSRELAVLETLDNGKPIKETRDADLPLVAAHFFYYAGWADKLDHAGFGADPRPLGVAGQVIPWNFPLLMLAWKIAPALATGNTVVLKPAETTPSPPCSSRTSAARRACPRVSSTSFRGTATRAPRSSRTRTSTRSPSPAPRPSARRSRAPSRAPTRSSPSNSAARARTSSSTTPPSTRPSKASSPASSSTRARSAARAPVSSSRSRSTTSCWTRSSAACPPSASAIPWTRTRTSARSTPPSSCPVSPRSSSRARPRAPSAGPRPANSLRRLLVRPDALHERHPGAHHRPRRDLRPGPVRSHVPDPRRGRRQGQQLPVRPLRRHLDREGLPDPGRREQTARGRHLVQHVQQVRPDLAVRRLQGVGLRPRGRPSRPGGVPRCLRRPTRASSSD